MSKPPRLEQFSASYDSSQDRVLLRVRTSDDAEFRFWLTRRYLALLWPLLMQMADDFSARKAPNDPLARSALAELAHGEAVGGANFGSGYRDGSIFPLGEEPILLARISIKAMQEGSANRTLTLLPQEGQGINLQLDEKLVHILARLLQEAANAAEWELKLRVSPGALAPTPDTAAPRRLH